MALNKTAFSKRAEQLKRYEDSETNRESVVPKNPNERKVRFSAGCIFLAACAAGDKDEVLNMLNSGGADIDTANVDGLTALHQACIEDNLDMVEFLVTHGANVNRKDNEGWTPLHATSSCGIVSIARYLIENGADLASVNSDGELPIDIAGTNAMADLLQHYIDEQGIDCDEARQQEEKLMLSDAKKWLRSDASEADRPHPKTGATALHVAAAKGYTKVLSLLLAGRADVDRQDNDGWTPLHAACYWGKKEAAQMLIASMADMDILNYSNQTCIEIAPKEMIPWLEELRKNNKRTKRRPVSQIRISDNNIDNNIESPPKVIRVELKSPAEQQTTNECDFENSESDMEDEEEEEDDNEEEEEEESEEESESAEEEQKQTNKMTTAKDQMQLPLTKENDSMDDIKQKQDNPTQVPVKENQTNNDSEVILRRTQSFENDEKFYQKYIELRARIKANSCPALPATQITIAKDDSNKESVTKSSTNFIIQRSASLKDHRSQLSNRKIDEKTPPTSPTTPTTPASTPSGHLRRSFVPPTRDEESETQRKAHAKRVRETRRSTQGVTLDEIKSAEQLVKMKNASNSNGNTENTNSSELNERLSDTTTIAAETSIMKTDDSSINEEVNVNYTISSPLRKTLRSSVDKEDEENDQKISATFTISPPSSRTNVNSISQLANRLEKGLDLETEVSATINVPLISPTKNNADSCEKLKKTDPPVPQPRSLFDIDNATSIKLADKLQEEAKKCDVNTVSDEPSPLNHLTEPLPPSPIHHTIFGERRPSWRLKTDYNNKFKLEDTSQSSTSTGNSTQQPQTNSTNGIDLSKVTTNTPVVSTRRQNSSENSVPNDTSSAVTKETPVTPNRSDDDKENDKENDSRSGLAIHRRRRPKRRSTGVVHVDMEEIDPEYRQESPVEDNNKDTSGNESRSCAESLASNSLNTNDDGEFIDYKALYEAAKTENELLRASLKSREQDLAAAKLALERLTAAATKSSLSENEKREKRAMERKISEMEEELKQMDALKTENQRLKDENGALIRVISKLSK